MHRRWISTAIFTPLNKCNSFFFTQGPSPGQLYLTRVHSGALNLGHAFRNQFQLKSPLKWIGMNIAFPIAISNVAM